MGIILVFGKNMIILLISLIKKPKNFPIDPLQSSIWLSTIFIPQLSFNQKFIFGHFEVELSLIVVNYTER